MASDNALVPFEPPVIRVGLLDRLREWAFPRPKTSLANVDSTVQTVPQTGSGLFTLVNNRGGWVLKTNATTYRAWSESSVPIRVAIDILRDAVSSAEWDILPIDKTGPKNVRIAKRIKALMEEPNPRDSFWDFSQLLVEDICVLDAGAAEKVRYPSGELAELWPVMGETIGVNAKWDGSNPSDPRYIWIPDGTVKGTFANDDMLYLMQNPRTNSAVGLSPLEVLKNVIVSELNSVDYNSRMLRGAPPEGALNIGENAMKEDVQSAKVEWESEILGQTGFAIIGGYKAPSFLRFRDTNQEMQFREWLDYLNRQIAVAFGLSPMDLGITFDVNRSTAEAQGENSEGRGMRPLMAKLETAFTRHVVHDESFGGRNNNLRFAFTALNLKESKNRADINKIAMGSTPWKSANEARLMDGRPPLGDLDDENNVFNHVLALTPKGLMDITTGTYIGEAELAKVQADAQLTLADAKAEAVAANPDKTQPTDVGGSQA